MNPRPAIYEASTLGSPDNRFPAANHGAYYPIAKLSGSFRNSFGKIHGKAMKPEGLKPIPVSLFPNKEGRKAEELNPDLKLFIQHSTQ